MNVLHVLGSHSWSMYMYTTTQDAFMRNFVCYGRNIFMYSQKLSVECSKLAMIVSAQKALLSRLSWGILRLERTAFVSRCLTFCWRICVRAARACSAALCNFATSSRSADSNTFASRLFAFGRANTFYLSCDLLYMYVLYNVLLCFGCTPVCMKIRQNIWQR